MQFVLLTYSLLVGLSIPSSNEYAAIVAPNIVPSDATNILVGETLLYRATLVVADLGWVDLNCFVPPPA